MGNEIALRGLYDQPDSVYLFDRAETILRIVSYELFEFHNDGLRNVKSVDISQNIVRQVPQSSFLKQNVVKTTNSQFRVNFNIEMVLNRPSDIIR